ncbi:MAG: adenosylhomocysteinase [Acidimicrobiales bacterium]
MTLKEGRAPGTEATISSAARSDQPSRSDAALGEAQIEWVRRRSPVLDGFVRQRLKDGALRDVKLAVVLQLEAKTAFLATVLAEAGARVVVAGSNPRTTRGHVVQALDERGLTVVAKPGSDHDSWERELLSAADTDPDYVIDDGAELTVRMARHRPELFARLKGVSEQTTTGTSRLQALADEGRLPFPALSANNARCKHLFDNVYGTGQTTLQAVLKLTNRQIGGARLAVFGYGFVGRGIARFARAMGARTYVVEVDPVRALEAHMDGHTVGNAEDVLPEASIVITASGVVRTVSERELSFLRHDVVLANAGHQDLEIDVEALAKLAGGCVRSRDGIETFRLDGRDIHVLSGGALVNIAGGMGHPVEVMDLSFAVQALGVHHLVTEELAPGVHVLPAELDDAIATAKLTSLGIRVGEPRAPQDLAELEVASGALGLSPAPDEVTEGERRIAWAGRSMPVLAALRGRLAEAQTLAGLRVGICLVLEPKTANLALALRAAGAEVGLYCAGRNTSDPVAKALARAGLQVFAEEGASSERDAELARGLLATAPEILIDDSATLIRMLHREFPLLLDSVLGGAEETTSGVRPLRVMHENGELRIPVIAVNDARTKYLFDNVYGTGQSCVMTLLDVTNLQLAGRRLAVVGYGWVGKGVARYASALGARIVVSEIDPIKALQAHHEGFEVRNLADAASDVEIVVAATGLAGAVTEEHLAKMLDGVILCTAGGGSFELPMSYLHSLGTGTEVREAVTEYVLPNGRRVLVISDGESLNCAAGEGNPIEIMDLSLSLQALAAECIATEARHWPPGVYPLTPQMEEAVALSRLRYEGASLQKITDELAAAMNDW